MQRIKKWSLISKIRIVNRFLVENMWKKGEKRRQQSQESGDTAEICRHTFSFGEAYGICSWCWKIIKYTLSKANNLILNIDGAIGSLLLDLLEGSGTFSKVEFDEIVEIGYLNGLFVLARSIGLIGWDFLFLFFERLCHIK